MEARHVQADHVLVPDITHHRQTHIGCNTGGDITHTITQVHIIDINVKGNNPPTVIFVFFLLYLCYLKLMKTSS